MPDVLVEMIRYRSMRSHIQSQGLEGPYLLTTTTSIRALICPFARRPRIAVSLHRKTHSLILVPE